MPTDDTFHIIVVINYN